MSVKRILICDPIHEEGVEMLRGAGFEVDLRASITQSELVNAVRGYDAIVVRSRTHVTGEVLDAGDRLKVVARSGVGLDNVDLEAAERRGVEVVNSPEAPSNAVAELTLGLMLSLARKIAEADASMKRGEWAKGKLTGFELSGKTLGIIGFGRIGHALAEKAEGLGMRVVTLNRNVERRGRHPEEAGVEAVSFEELLSASDFVSLHVPLRPETRHMIGREQIGVMKDGAYLINTSRGGIVDEEALRETLVNGKLAGAALDVYEREPPAGTSLTGLANVVCTPHIGASSVEAQRANSTIVAEKLMRLLS
jgi:D-3-phosphoglycerate dehydrogenase